MNSTSPSEPPTAQAIARRPGTSMVCVTPPPSTTRMNLSETGQATQTSPAASMAIPSG